MSNTSGTDHLSEGLVALRVVSGHYPVMAGDIQVPEHEKLVGDLTVLREKSLVRLRQLTLPALQQAVQAAGEFEDSPSDPVAIEALLRRAVEGLGGGEMGEAAEYLFGLVQGARGWKPKDLRERAAGIYNLSPERFRKEQQRLIIGQVADEILKLCHEQVMRVARLQLERRLPTESRLAVQWVERFEAYYTIWTPAWRLAADLRACVATRREEDPGHAPWDPEEPWDQEDQARGYARFALYAYAWYQLALKKFMIRHGGLWLLSSGKVEQDVVDAIYRIGWHNPLNVEDDSWLRRTLAETKLEEEQPFFCILRASTIGLDIHKDWQDYVASCTCPSNDAPLDACQVHATIAACDDYCRLIDEDWRRIADWYHPGEQLPRGISGDQLYQRLLRAQEAERQGHLQDAKHRQIDGH